MKKHALHENGLILYRNIMHFILIFLSLLEFLCEIF